MNILNCPSCNNTLSCFKCPRSSKNSFAEIFELSGTLIRNLGSKWSKNGKKYYFGTLELEDGDKETIFFFKFEPQMEQKIENLNQGDKIKVNGFRNNKGAVTVKEIIEVEESVEIF